jgi:hypothetical protein
MLTEFAFNTLEFKVCPRMQRGVLVIVVHFAEGPSHFGVIC